MSIIITSETRVVVQGITGRSGRRATKEMLVEGTKVLCGVTPGKGGADVEGLPVFDSVKEAKEHDSELNTSVILVPPLLVLDAAMEAIDAGLSLIVIITENVPVKDSAKIVAYAKRKGTRVIGPSSVGVMSPGLGKLGLIGSAKERDMFMPGRVGIISKSGGMCAETSRLLTRLGIGQSTVVGIGGDIIVGSTFSDLLLLFEEDDETEVVVLYGEIGGVYEEVAAELVASGAISKPVVAFVSGQFAEKLGKGLALGHAGAIVEEGFGSALHKKEVLRNSGVIVADYHHEIPDLVRLALEEHHVGEKAENRAENHTENYGEIHRDNHEEC